ncbi:hypothetical protein CSB45_07725 [candidate division KSB3 bacterium]|uniref:Uncharacterized protein n=1 Tax=candidate division KSB3 bacterium TaxID=2044937 RepID=A0A2G6E6A4_9BACT|nr:MAG: hypothetical protein CSB45_07725 [candidate division KSB3 bacterium]PIE29920.1 MAG: hypothetical protein CSA57_06425 [candidate division KSB3 bacterium]
MWFFKLNVVKPSKGFPLDKKSVGLKCVFVMVLTLPSFDTLIKSLKFVNFSFWIFMVLSSGKKRKKRAGVRQLSERQF